MIKLTPNQAALCIVCAAYAAFFAIDATLDWLRNRKEAGRR